MSAPLQRVAVIGASGRLGGAFANALLKTGKHTVTALTRVGSKGKIPEGAKKVEVNYDDDASIVAALKDQQFLAITLSVDAPRDLHARIAQAAGKAGVQYIMPNAYGYPSQTVPAVDDLYGNFTLDRIRDVSSNGVSAPITLSCGFWYEWSLALGNEWFGFTIAERKVTFFDDGKRVITISTWDQCGRALAALLSLPESGASPSFADFTGETNGVLIQSWRVSQRDMLDSLHRVLGTTDADWEISYEPVAKRVVEGSAAMKAGDRRGFAKVLYGGVFEKSNAASDYVGKANEILGLPKEDFDEATKRAVDMVESGWSPFSDI